MRTLTPLNPTELEWLARFLEESAEMFEDHGNNDFLLPASDENKAIIAAVRDRHGPDDFNDPDAFDSASEEMLKSSGELYMYDCWVMDHFAKRCKQQTDPALSPAEYRVIAILLDLVVEVYPEDEDFWPEYAYPATEGNKALFADVFEYRGDKDAAQAAREATEEVDISDFPIYVFLANKCRQLADTIPPDELGRHKHRKSGIGENVTTIERPGINAIWAKTRKSDYSPSQLKMGAENFERTLKKLEYYVQHGVMPPSRFDLPGEPPKCWRGGGLNCICIYGRWSV